MKNEELRAEMQVFVDYNGARQSAKVIDCVTLRKGKHITITGWKLHVGPSALEYTTTADKIYPKT